MLSHANMQQHYFEYNNIYVLWRDRELNSRPPGYESDALTI